MKAPWGTAAAAAIASTVLAAGAFLGPAASASEPNYFVGSECHDVVVLGARGSGQAADSARGFGPEVQDVATTMVTRLRAQGDDRDVGFQWVPYVANSVDLLFADAGTYFDELNHGRDLAVAWLNDRAISCPSEQYVLMGYSQGAMVMHRTLQDRRLSEPGRIVTTVLVADGDRVRNSPVLTYGTAKTAAQGVADSRLGRLVGQRVGEMPAGALGRTVTVCNDRDVVCDFRGRYDSFGAKVHVAYTGTDFLSAAGATAATAVHRRAVPDFRPLHPAVDEPLSAQLSATGAGPMAYRFADTTSVPAWLHLSASGLLTGTPTVTGDYSVNVEVAGADGYFVIGQVPIDVVRPGPPPPPPPPPGLPMGPALVSHNSSGEASSYYSRWPSISADGSLVAWTSPSPELGQADRTTGCFVTDMVTGAVTLVSLDQAGQPLASGVAEFTRGCTLSPQGDSVVFTAAGQDVHDGTGATGAQVYMRNWRTGDLRLVSAAPDGTPANGLSNSDYWGTQISIDGHLVSFHSAATNLSGDGVAHTGMYVKDLATGGIHLYEAEPYSSYQMSASGSVAAALPSRDYHTGPLTVTLWRDGVRSQVAATLTDQRWQTLDWCLSGDGTYLFAGVAVADASGGSTPFPSELVRIDLNTRSVETLAQEDPQWAPFWVRSSQDGSAIVYTTARATTTGGQEQEAVEWRAGHGVSTLSQGSAGVWAETFDSTIALNGSAAAVDTLQVGVGGAVDTNSDIDTIWIPLPTS